jgi:hypothetical protein
MTSISFPSRHAKDQTPKKARTLCKQARTLLLITSPVAMCGDSRPFLAGQRPTLETRPTALNGQRRSPSQVPCNDAGIASSAIPGLSSASAATAQNLHSAQN